MINSLPINCSIQKPSCIYNKELIKLEQYLKSYSKELLIKKRYNAISKRIFDLLLVVPGIIITLPFFLIIIICIKIDSSGPAIFRQIRVGLNRKKFYIYKFRTMSNVKKSIKRKLFTLESDQRITRVGKLLRKFKLDELPQLFNVLIGNMSLVGPRPMLTQHISRYPYEVRRFIFCVPPGLTDYASMLYIDENELLSKVDDPQSYYEQKILPTKLLYNLKYIHDSSIWIDLKIICITLAILVGQAFGKGGKIKRFLLKDIQGNSNLE